ncbi:tryptophan synthase subunit beta, partial [Listeria monocytogenes]|nr:tryptophan synthase subunit beta [Listeria monocytogenes]
MEITYLVGNGFDMMYGLKTSYDQFYDYMLREFPKNKIKNNFFYNQ